MKETAVALCLLLQGCAHLIPYIEAHAVPIAAVGAVAATVSSTESAVVNAITLERDLKK